VGATLEPIVVRGSSPLVLVAPHGGQRDYDRRRWGSAPLKVNDLHTASLTEELAAATGASAVINPRLDRNDVDLNRLSSAHERAPVFLEQLAELLSSAIARHGYATVLTVHGWNVIQPAVDLGFGCAQGAALDASAAVSPEFAATAVSALMRACRSRGIAATVGARYPARGRENLVQLFTPRYRADPRPLVQQLAALGARANAVQLELGVPLRWPGAWRCRLVEACVAVLPSLLGTTDGGESEPLPPEPAATKGRRHTLEICGSDTAALVSMDPASARLLLFPPDGTLALFTGERTGGEAPVRVGGLQVEAGDGGRVQVRFAGPMLRFPDSTPFLDLERGLAGASPVEQAEVALDFIPVHPDVTGAAEFGSVRGVAMLDGSRLSLDGRALSTRGAGVTVWPRVRASLDLGDRGRLSLTVGLDGGPTSGFLCQDGRHQAVVAAEARLGHDEDRLAGLVLAVELEGGDRLQLRPEPMRRLPVVRGGAPAPVRLVYACCSLGPGTALAGWCEIGGF
jgi:hypothetical protein